MLKPQGEFTGMVLRVRTLITSGLFSWQQRRLKGDLIAVFRILKGFHIENKRKLFPVIERWDARGFHGKITRSEMGFFTIYIQSGVKILLQPPERMIEANSTVQKNIKEIFAKPLEKNISWSVGWNEPIGLQPFTFFHPKNSIFDWGNRRKQSEHLGMRSYL